MNSITVCLDLESTIWGTLIIVQEPRHNWYGEVIKPACRVDVDQILWMISQIIEISGFQGKYTCGVGISYTISGESHCVFQASNDKQFDKW